MIKKRNLLWLLVPAMAIVSVGCTQEPATGEENAPSGKIKLAATFENVQDEGSTKVDISTSSGAFSWTEGDKIAVHTSTPNWKTATLESGAGSASGEFTAQMNDTDRDGYAIYPASVAGGSADAPTITLPSSYTIDGSMGTFSPLPMIAKNEPGTALAFKQVGAIFRITLNKVPEGTKSIVVTMDKQITGTFTVDVSDASAPKITSAGESNNTVTFNFSTAFAAETDNVALNLPVPVGTYSGLSVECQNSSGTALSRAMFDNSRAVSRATGCKLSLLVMNPIISVSVAVSSSESIVYVNDGGKVQLTATPEYSFAGEQTATYSWEIVSGDNLTLTNATSATVTLNGGSTAGTTSIKCMVTADNSIESSVIYVAVAPDDKSIGGKYALSESASYYVAKGNLLYDGSAYSIGSDYLSGISSYNTNGGHGSKPSSSTPQSYWYSIPSHGIPDYVGSPTKNRWYSDRSGATAVGSSTDGGKLFCMIQLTGLARQALPNGGNATSRRTVLNGVLLFPDGATITTGVDFSNFMNAESGTFAWSSASAASGPKVSVNEMKLLILQGCVFLPASGLYASSTSRWDYGGTGGYYREGGILSFGGNGFNNTSFNFYVPVRLVREVRE